jgi:hypothetical protein
MSFSKGTNVRLKATSAIPVRYHGRTATVVSNPQPNSRFVAEVNARETGKPNQTRLLALTTRDVTAVA